MKFVTHGVPQRSILGPLFFIVFMNDVSLTSQLLFSIFFADDTRVFIDGQNYDQLIKILQNRLKILDVWLQAINLTLNAEKKHYMVFHRARIIQGYNKIILRNTEISLVKSTKFLGVIMDDKLN